jgi:hypothetical protein
MDEEQTLAVTTLLERLAGGIADGSIPVPD